MAGGIGWLFDTSGFVPRSRCGRWSDELLWMHAGSDVLIWLAYTAIPLTLLFFARHRRTPFTGLFWLFAAFIVCCGATHLVEAVMFERPLYRLSGVAKLTTAVVSWATVIALIPAAPRVLKALDVVQGLTPDTPPEPPPDPLADRAGRVAGGVVLAAAMLAARQALDPLLGQLHPYILPLLGVVAAAWHGGLWPGLAALAVGYAGAAYLFVPPRASVLVVSGLPNQLGAGLFVFVGAACALLGEAQRQAARRAAAAAADLRRQQAELEAEVGRRVAAEADLRRYAGDLARYADDLEAARRQAAETLAQLDTFVLQAPVGLAYLDADLRFVRVNRHLTAADPRPLADPPGRPLLDVVADLPAAIQADLRQALAGRPAAGRRVVVPTAAGDHTWDLSYYPVRDRAGPVLGVGLVARDITAELRAESDLRASEARFRELADALARANADLQREVGDRLRAEQALKDADRRKDEFLATLAHELRNPLAPIRNAVEILRLAPDDGRRAATARDVLVRQVAQMVRLIDDLLDVSRITRGKLRLVVAPVDLRAVADAALEMSRPLADKAGVAVAVDLPGHPVWVTGDRLRLAQVVSNLLNNAAKFTDRGGTVALTVGRSGSRAVVRVADTGVGIPADALPRLFELFTQVDKSVARSQGGLGIGLALVKRLVEMHHGTVAAHSDGPGRGATFTVDLPAADPPPGEPVPAANGTAGASGGGVAVGHSHPPADPPSREG